MPGKTQTLSQEQREEVVKIFRNKILVWILVALALLTGVTGLSLWGIKCRLEHKLENLVAQQFEEPRVQEVVNKAAETKANYLLDHKINPEVKKFTEKLDAQKSKIDKFLSDTEQNLKGQTKDLEQEIRETKARIFGVESDLAEIQKGIIAIEYYADIGRNRFPNPYGKKIEEILNKLLLIAEPDQQKRSEFIKELESYKLDK